MLIARSRLVRQAPWLVWLSLVASPSLTMGAQLTLTWNDSAGNESGYRVERKIGSGGSYSEIAVLGANTTGYTDPNLAASTTYCYRVRAFNAAGVSGYSNEACAATAQSTLNLTVTKLGPERIRLELARWHQLRKRLYESFRAGPFATRTVTPNSGSRFDGWSGGGCAGSGPCTLSGNGSPMIRATFTATGASASLTASPTTIARGGTVTATWSGIPSPTPTDWVGLYAPGTADSAFLAWMYVSCSQTPGERPGRGIVRLPDPRHTRPGRLRAAPAGQ